MVLKPIYLALAFLCLCQSSLVAMEQTEESEKPFNPRTPTSIVPFRFSENDDSPLQEFQPQYSTIVADEEWKEVPQILNTLNHPLLELWPERKEALFKNYKETFHTYYVLYNRMRKGGRNYLKELLKRPEFLSNELFPTLFQFVTDFEDVYDQLRTSYQKGSKERKQLEGTIFPIVQRTFNFYMKVYETLTSNKLTNLGSLNYSQIQSSTRRLKHLYYKKDDNGFLIFTLYPHKRLKDGYYESYIPFRSPNEEHGEHSVIFKIKQSSDQNPSEKLKIVQQPGFLIQKRDGDIVIQHYRGNLNKDPYSTDPGNRYLNTKRIKAWSQMLMIIEELRRRTEEESNEKELLEKSAEAFLKMSNDNAPIDAQQGGIIIQSHKQTLDEELRDVYLLNFSERFLGEDTSGFIPLPRTPLEQLECNYLCLLECRQRLESQEVSSGDLYLLEYLTGEEITESNFKEHLTDTLVQYKEALKNDYRQEEEDAYRLEQEQRQAMVRNGDHYKGKVPSKKQGRSKGKNQQKKHGKSQSNRQTVQQASPLQSESKHIEKAKERFQKLKNGQRGRKFRNYIKIVNGITQEMAKEGLKVTGQLNQSSHGTFKAKGSKPTTVVRPHGKRNTVSLKGSKKSLNSLFNTYFSHKEEKK